MKVSEIKSIIDSYMNPVIEVFSDILINEAMDIFEKDLDIIIAMVASNGNMLLVDKDILLKLMLKKTDVKKSIVEFGSKDYCFMDHGFSS